MVKKILLAIVALVAISAFTGCTTSKTGKLLPSTSMLECVENLTAEHVGYRVSINVPTEKGGMDFTINDVSVVPTPTPNFTEDGFVKMEAAQKERALTQYAVTTLKSLENANIQLQFVKNLVEKAKNESQTIPVMKPDVNATIVPSIPTLDELAEQVKAQL
jgi:hypothetical protein